MREKLSVVVITKNESAGIERFLNGLKWVDEIVVVDDESGDETPKICKSMGAKVITNKSDGDFDHQRNLGIEAANGDWILQMDADEVVPENLQEDIIKILENPYLFSAYKFKRKNFFLGHFMKYGGWYGGYSTKLFKKGKARYIGKSVHETLEVDGETGIIHSDIEHFPFGTISQFVERQNFYSSVEAKLIFEKEGRLPDKEINYNLKIKPLKRFWKFYVKKQGFREGVYGLIFSVLFAWVHFLNWAKYWEIVKEKQGEQ